MKRVIYFFIIALIATLSTSVHAFAQSQVTPDANTGTTLPINSGVAYLIIVGAVVGAVFLRKAVLGSEAENQY